MQLLNWKIDSFILPAGKSVAIVGTSGNGKSLMTQDFNQTYIHKNDIFSWNVDLFIFLCMLVLGNVNLYAMLCF